MTDFKTTEEQCSLVQKLIEEWKSAIHGEINVLVCAPKTKELLKGAEIDRKIKIISDARLEDGIVYIVPVKSLPPYIEHRQSDFKEELK